MNNEAGGAEDSVTLHLPRKDLAHFLPLLQKGFAVKTRMGLTVAAFLCGHFGLSSQYVKERIQTIFLDGEPVDDENSALLRNGTVLALSSAMPGLLGATLRKGSPLKSLRQEISHREHGSGKPEEPQEGTVTVKLFNFMIPELAGIFLERGIGMEKRELGRILERILEETGNRPFPAERNHERVDVRELRETMKGGSGKTFLRIEAR